MAAARTTFEALVENIPSCLKDVNLKAEQIGQQFKKMVERRITGKPDNRIDTWDKEEEMEKLLRLCEELKDESFRLNLLLEQFEQLPEDWSSAKENR